MYVARFTQYQHPEKNTLHRDGMTCKCVCGYAQITGSTGLCLQPLAPTSSRVGGRSHLEYALPHIHRDFLFLLQGMELPPGKREEHLT